MKALLCIVTVAASAHFSVFAQVPSDGPWVVESVSYFGPSHTYRLTIKTDAELPILVDVPGGVQVEVQASRAPLWDGVRLPMVFRGDVFIRARRFVPVSAGRIQRIDLGEYNLALALKNAEVEIAIADPAR